MKLRWDHLTFMLLIVWTTATPAHADVAPRPPDHWKIYLVNLGDYPQYRFLSIDYRRHQITECKADQSCDSGSSPASIRMATADDFARLQSMSPKELDKQKLTVKCTSHDHLDDQGNTKFRVVLTDKKTCKLLKTDEPIQSPGCSRCSLTTGDRPGWTFAAWVAGLVLLTFRRRRPRASISQRRTERHEEDTQVLFLG